MNCLLKKVNPEAVFMILTFAVFTISAIALQVTATSSPLSTEVAFKNSGLISYGQLPSVARPLRVEGNQIKNDLGETVYLKGFNIHGHFHDAISGAWGAWDYYDSTIVDKILDRLKSYGVNFVRLFTNVQCWVNNPTVNSNIPNLKWRDMLKDFLSRAKARGIYVTFTDYTVKPYPCHDFDYCGYPPFATEDERDVLPTKQAFIDYIVSRTIELGQFENYIAEFWNEPYWMDEQTAKEWQSVWQTIINNIRAKGYNGLVLAQYSYGLGLWAKDHPWGNLNWYYNYPLKDPLGNIIISFHIYRTEGDKVQLPYSYNELRQIYNADFHIKDISLEVPTLAGEIGGNINYENEDLFLTNSLKILNEWGIGYAAFCYSDIVWSWQTLVKGTMWITGGDLAKHGQIIVDAIKESK